MRAPFLPSYARRRIRPLTQKAQWRLKHLLPLYQWRKDTEAQKCALEIGFGAGEVLAQLADMDKETLFIGAEPYIKGVASLLRHMELRQLTNIRIFQNDGRLLLPHLKDNSLDAIYLFFPDPWHKRRHHKRRLVCDELAAQFFLKLKKKGKFYFASDNGSYLLAVWRLMRGHGGFHLDEKSRDAPHFAVSSRYWHKAQAKGKDALFLTFIRH